MAGSLFGKLVFDVGSHYPVTTILVLGVLAVLVINKTIIKYNAGDKTYKDWLKLLIFILVGFVGIAILLINLNSSSF